jgi:putative ABC transport system permease protein
MALFHTRLFLRIISKDRELYYLKVITLAIAFGSSALILAFSLSEFGYDRFHVEYQSIFRILQRNNEESYDRNRLSNKIPEHVASSLKSLTNDSIILSRVKLMKDLNVKALGQTFYNCSIYAADPAITSVFSFDVLHGTIDNFGYKEKKVLLSSASAVKYFGTSNAVGKELKIFTLKHTLIFTIAAVYKDFPHNSHEAFDSFIAFNKADLRELNFDPAAVAIYGKDLKGDLTLVQEKVNSIPNEEGSTYFIQPLSEIYFGPRVLGEEARHGDHYSITILICITSLIFFLALTSYINLTTLSLPNRSKELAIKKLAGTGSRKILISFTKESLGIVFLSATIGMILLLGLSNWITPILSMSVGSLLLQGGIHLILILLILLAIVAISPLFLVVRFAAAAPTRLLSTDTITFPRFKRTIIFLQLGISIFLIVASMVLRRQVTYSLLKEPGRNYDQIVYANYPNDLDDEGLRNLRAMWQKNTANILDVLGVTQLPNKIKSKEVHTEFYFVGVDPEFGKFFDVQIIKGNWFKANAGDSIVVVNEAAEKMLENDTQNVVGVFKDFAGQFNQPEKPVKINLVPHFNYNFLCIKILEVDIRKTINFLSAYFGKGTQRITISFLDRRFEEWLRYQDRLNSLSEILAVISGLLSCCAIYGLSISIVRDKLKQIAVHKLFGASTFRIVRLLIREFTAEMIKAILVFGPLTYIIINELLRSFVYATDFRWTDPVIPLAYCLVVIILLCVFQTLSLSRSDLSHALKK